MRTVIDYYIEVASSEEVLSESIREMLQQGWQPFGRPFEDSSGEFLQAVVKYKESA